MRKIFIGFVLGISLSLTATALANTEMVGKTIQGSFPLFIDGKKAEKEVIVVEGTSYLPVRAAGEMFGYQVNFENNTVILNEIEKPIEPIEPIEEEPSEREEGAEVEDLKKQLRRVNVEFGEAYQFYFTYMANVERLESQEKLTEEEKQELEANKRMANEKLELANQLEKQIKDIEKQLEQLQASE